MVIKDALKEGVDLMEGLDYANPSLEVRLILAELLGLDKNYIFFHGDEEISIDIYDEFMEIMKKRARGYPLQYILGRQEFMGLELYIEEGVLIPRPETEIMVEYVIDKIKKDPKKSSVLDIGSGSGAISISIGKYCPNTSVYGLDIDKKAIKVGNINKKKLNLSNLDFIEGDLFKAREIRDRRFHIIVSNPPYIRTRDIEDLQVEVRDFEPRRALDGGLDGLDFYRKISSRAKDHLHAEGMLIYEIGYDQGKSVKRILAREGFSEITTLKDLQGHDRIVIACWR